jgi:hypothetical protein
MDPLSIASSINSISILAETASKTLRHLFRSAVNVPEEIQELTREIDALHVALRDIRQAHATWLHGAGSSVTSYGGTLINILQDCHETLQKLDSYLRDKLSSAGQLKRGFKALLYLAIFGNDIASHRCRLEFIRANGGFLSNETTYRERSYLKILVPLTYGHGSLHLGWRKSEPEYQDVQQVSKNESRRIQKLLSVLLDLAYPKAMAAKSDPTLDSSSLWDLPVFISNEYRHRSTQQDCDAKDL